MNSALNTYLPILITVNGNPFVSHKISNQMKNLKFVLATFSLAPSH